MEDGKAVMRKTSYTECGEKYEKSMLMDLIMLGVCRKLRLMEDRGSFCLVKVYSFICALRALV